MQVTGPGLMASANCGTVLPHSAHIKSKMIDESAKDRFKRELDGIQVETEATEPTYRDKPRRPTLPG